MSLFSKIWFDSFLAIFLFMLLVPGGPKGWRWKVPLWAGSTMVIVFVLFTAFLKFIESRTFGVEVMPVSDAVLVAAGMALLAPYYLPVALVLLSAWARLGPVADRLEQGKRSLVLATAGLAMLLTAGLGAQMMSRQGYDRILEADFVGNMLSLHFIVVFVALLLPRLVIPGLKAGAFLPDYYEEEEVEEAAAS